MSQSLLVRGRWIVTGGAPDDVVLGRDRPGGAALRIEAGRIAELGDWDDLRARHPQARVLGSERVALLPGLINAHHHSNGVTLQQQGIADDLLESWLLTTTLARPLDRRLAAQLDSAKLLQSGVTTVVDVHSDGGRPEAYEANARRALEGYRAAGIRATLALSLMTRSFLVPGEGADRAFLDGLPAALRRFAAGRLPQPGDIGEDDWLALVEQLHGELAGEPRLDLWLAPPGPQWVSDALMLRIAEAAERLDAGVQTHVTESLYEGLHGPREWGKGTVEHLAELGVLSPRFSLAHGVWLGEREIERLAESGAALVHNPSSNLRLRAGIAPLNALLEAGVTVALGMDGTTLGDDEDLFAELRLALRLHRAPRYDGPAPSEAAVFGLPTAGGARLLRREGELGTLRPGAAADVVLLDLTRPTWPWVAPEIDPLAFLVQRARAGDVEAVLVGGELVLKEGRPTGFDLEEAAREAAAQLAAASRDPQEAALVERLRAAVERHYLGWEIPEQTPWTLYNARR